jgi:hypothetical protein
MRARIAALWCIPFALIVAGFAVAWGSAVGTAERYSGFAQGPLERPDVDWTAILNISASPVLLAGFVALIVAIAVQALLWRPRGR